MVTKTKQGADAQPGATKFGGAETLENGGGADHANDNIGGVAVLTLAAANPNAAGTIAWDPDSAVARELRDDIAVDADIVTAPTQRKLLGFLDEVSRTHGTLPIYFEKPYSSRIARMADLHPHALMPGGAAGKLLRKYFGRFLHVTVEPPRLKFERPQSVAFHETRKLLEKCAAENIPIPTAAGGKRLSLEGIALMLNLQKAALRRSPSAQALIWAAVRDGTVKLGAIHIPARGTTPEEDERRRAELWAIADGFDVPGGKVPEHRSGAGNIDFDYIASLSGTVHPTGEDDPAYVAHVEGIAARRGTIMPGLLTGDDTLAKLRAWGLQRVREEQETKGSKDPDGVVAAYRSAFDRFVKLAGLASDDLAAAVFGEGFEERRTAAVAGYGNVKSARNFDRLIGNWQAMNLARVGAADLPAAFGDSLRLLIDRKCVTPGAVGRECGVDPRLIGNWARGTSAPSAVHADAVGILEDIFSLPRGTLLCKIGRMIKRSQGLKDATPEWRALDRRLRALLPVEAATWRPAKLADAVEQVRPLLGAGTAYSEVGRVANSEEYRYPVQVLPDRVMAHREDYIGYKRAPTTYPLVRSKNARWKSDSSETHRMQGIDNIFKFAGSPASDRPNGGLGIPMDLATYGWLGQVPLTLSFIASRTRRFATVEFNGEARGNMYTGSESEIVSHLVSITNPVTGWLAQHPELAETMRPVEVGVPQEYTELLSLLGRGPRAALLSEEDVREARRDWVGWVGRAHQAYIQALAYVEDEAEVSRNPVEPIAGLLKADEPVYEFLALAFAAERKWAAEATSQNLYRLDVRNSVLARLAPITGFRPDNTMGLDFTGDHRGRIRKVDGVWEIEVPYKEFKNYRSCRLFGPKTARQNYKLQLVDEAGLYDILDLWFFDCLPGLRDGREGHEAFLTKSGLPMDTLNYNSAFSNWGVRHVAWNPVLRTGFPGVTSLNPYVMRHLRASDTLKNGVSHNRVEEASFAIQTSERMIRKHYGFLLPEQALQDSYKTFSKAAVKAWQVPRD